MEVATFTFNDFFENTYILFDETNECVIIDPGCYHDSEKETLSSFIRDKGLKPVRLVNTHCHIDHIFGNNYVSKTYGLELESHPGEKQVLDMQPTISQMYGISLEMSPPITKFLEDGDKLTFGNTSLDVLFTPGHSPASISFYCENSGILIAGDVLFKGSIGRTDLPGGDFNTLIDSIKTKFFPLPDDVIVMSGHGESTTIGLEKRSNPFLVG